MFGIIAMRIYDEFEARYGNRFENRERTYHIDLINLIPTKHYFVCHEVLGVHIAF